MQIRNTNIEIRKNFQNTKSKFLQLDFSSEV